MAQEQTGNGFYDFMYPKFLLSDLFDIQMQEDDYVERAYNVWRDIGNIATSIHAFEFEIGNDSTVSLPCNTEFVESVSSGHDYDCGENVILYSANWSTDPNQHLADALVSPNSNIHDMSDQKSRLHAEGVYIPYELKGTVGNYKLSFDSKQIGQKGVCIYRGVCVDSNGNPLLSRKETEAIAYKLAFIHLQKRIFTADPVAAQIMQQSNLVMEYGRKMAAAKIPEYVSQNQWNRMLSAMTSHNRKVYWSSFKTMQ